MPDGSTRTDGYLLKWWSEFWEQTAGVRSWQYCGDPLEEKFRVLLAANKALAGRLLINAERMSFCFLNKEDSLNAADRQFIEEYLQVRVFTNAGNIFLYLDEPKYRFSKPVRMILSACPACMGSPVGLGGLCYLMLIVFAPGLFSWASSPETLKWVLIIPFCVALSFLNYIISRKYDL